MRLTVGQMQRLIKEEFSKIMKEENLASKMGVMDAEEFMQDQDLNEQIQSSRDFEERRASDSKKNIDEILEKCFKAIAKDQEKAHEKGMEYFAINMRDIERFIYEQQTKLGYRNYDIDIMPILEGIISHMEELGFQVYGKVQALDRISVQNGKVPYISFSPKKIWSK